jgi:hypothetical protein
MKVTMVIPSYWGRKKIDGWKEGDAVYDHPIPIDEEGTLRRLLNSLDVLQNKNFNLVIIGAATSEEIEEEVESKISEIIKKETSDIDSLLFSHSHMKKIHQHLEKEDTKYLSPLLQLYGYSNIRNLCVFVPHLMESEIAVLIDDDEIFEDPSFIDKALEYIGKEKNGEKILAVAGYYINPDGDYLINKESSPWMIRWNKIDCMNRAFKEIISSEPRLKETPFAFGGNLVIHRDLFIDVPFDPSVPRGEDIDYLINARMSGYKVYLDNQLSIKHDAPPKSHPIWQQVREDIYRFVFEKRKLDMQEPSSDMTEVLPESLDPYPGEFLKDNLVNKISHSNQMLAIDYLSKGDKEGAQECMKNIFLAETHALPDKNPFQHFVQLRKNWINLMDYFSSIRGTQKVQSLIWG